jgi:hypothetical protein
VPAADRSTVLRRNARAPVARWRILQSGRVTDHEVSGTDAVHDPAADSHSGAGTQNPFAVIFGGSDSRLAAEIINICLRPLFEDIHRRQQ